jgi:GT2 family glycosyltransferase
MEEFSSQLKQKIARYDAGNPQRIAIIIKTINRKHSLLQTINSIFDFCDLPFRLYIADDGVIDQELGEFYRLLQHSGHFVRIYDHPVALTAALNELVRATDAEEFILRLDDDFRFCKETRVSVQRDILHGVDNIGAISGLERLVRKGAKSSEKIESKQGFYLRDGDALIELLMDENHFTFTRYQSHRFAIVHYSRNFLLIRRRVFDTVSWNEDLLFKGEHVDLSLRLAKAGWLIAFTPDTIHEHHDDELPPSLYTGRDVTPAAQARAQVMLRDHGIKRVRRVHAADVLSLRPPRKALARLRRMVGLRPPGPKSH